MMIPPEENPKQPEKRIMDLHTLGQLMFTVGIIIAVFGGVLMLVGRLPFFKSLGNLPGDIRIEGEGFACFMPIASMILLSILLTIALNIIARFINRP